MKLIALFVLSASFARPVSEPNLNVSYDSVQLAAVAALQKAVKISVKNEEAGGLFEMNGKFYYTIPATNRSDETFDITIKLPRGAKFLGIYHTHPNKGRNTDTFSPPDIETADQMNKISFIGVVQNGKIICYIPGEDKKIEKENYKNIRPEYISKGHEISFPLWPTEPNNK